MVPKLLESYYIWLATTIAKLTNMMVGEYGIQLFVVVVVVLLFMLLWIDVLVPTSAHSLLFLDK